MVKKYLIFVLLVVGSLVAMGPRGDIAHLVVAWHRNAGGVDNDFFWNGGNSWPREIKSLLDAGAAPLVVNGTLGRALLSLFVHVDLPEQIKPLWETLAATDLNSLDIYAQLDHAQQLVLFVPKQYRQRMGRSTGLGIEEPGSWKQITDAESWRAALEQLRPTDSSEDAEIIDAFKTIMSKPDPTRPLRWNIFFSGHGGLCQTADRAPVTELFQMSGAAIAGIPARAFLNIILDWYGLPFHSVAWSTCHGGGYHAQAVAQALNLRELALHKHGKPTAPMMVISLEVSDLAMIAPAEYDYTQFFDQLDQVDAAQPEAARAVAQAVHNISPQPPLILLPGKPRKWQMGDAAIFGRNRLVLDDNVPVSNTPFVVGPLDVFKDRGVVLVRSEKIPGTVRVDMLVHQPVVAPLFMSIRGGPSEHYLERVLLGGPFANISTAFFGAGALSPMETSFSDTPRFFAGSYATIFRISSLAYHATRRDQILEILGLGVPAHIVLHNVLIVQYPSTLVRGGWIVFTYTDEHGKSTWYRVEVTAGEALNQPGGTGTMRWFVREKRAVTNDAQSQRLTMQALRHIVRNVDFEQVAASGDVEYMKDLLNNQQTAPDRWGLNSAYIDASAVPAGAHAREFLSHLTGAQKIDQATVREGAEVVRLRSIAGLSEHVVTPAKPAKKAAAHKKNVKRKSHAVHKKPVHKKVVKKKPAHKPVHKKLKKPVKKKHVKKQVKKKLVKKKPAKRSVHKRRGS